MWQTLRSQSFEGVSGYVSFDAEGNRFGGWKLLNLQPDSSGGWGSRGVGDFNAVQGIRLIPPYRFPGNKSSPPTDTPFGPVRVGLLMGLSSRGAPIRTNYASTCAALLAIRHVNAKDTSVVSSFGSLPASFRIEATLHDTNYTSAGALLAYRTAREAGAFAVLGPERSDSSMSVGRISALDSVMQLSFRSWSTELSNKASYPTFARLCPSTGQHAIAAVNFIRRQFPWTNFFFLAVDDSYGFDYYLAFLAAASVQVPRMYASNFGFIPPEATVVDLIVDRIKASGTNIIVAVLLSGQVELVFRAADAAGLLDKGYVWILIDGAFLSSLSFSPDVRALLHGALTFDHKPPSNEAFTEVWMRDGASACVNPLFTPDPAIFTQPPSGVDIEAFDGVAALAMAMRGASDPRVGPQVMTALREMNFVAATGNLSFNSNADRSLEGACFSFSNLILTTDGLQLRNVRKLCGDVLDESSSHPIVWRGGEEGGEAPVDLLGLGCPAGMEEVAAKEDFGGFQSSPTCEICLAGSAKNGTNHAGCSVCSVGTIQLKAGQPECTPCPRGHWVK